MLKCINHFPAEYSDSPERMYYRDVAQFGLARSVRDAEVGGSNPPIPTKNFYLYNIVSEAVISGNMPLIVMGKCSLKIFITKFKKLFDKIEHIFNNRLQ